LAMLAPISPDQLNPASATPCTLSIVILNRRLMISPAPATDQQGQEEMVQVHWPTVNPSSPATQDSTINTGGGEFTLTDSNATLNATGRLGMVQPNQWIMLCRYLPHANSDGTYSPWVETKWYRVVAVGDTVPATAPQTGYTREITLAGPDWEADPLAAAAANPASKQPPLPNTITWPSAVPSASQNYNTYAVLIDGVVGVYQRVIHLNAASSEWSQ
ncbi:MAG TPA: hypothetical protein VMJ32_08700, partial [Pirellulales bacterium]|nr:hypothetical protein [Pirellulales bacterium]